MTREPLRLHRNEGRAPRPEAFAELAATGPELARRYPENDEVRQLVAASLGVDPECVLITAGGDDAIDRVFRRWSGPDRTLVVPDPTFQMIPAYARMSGAEVIPVPEMWRSFPRQEMVEAIDDRTGVAAIVTPNNPSGAVASVEDVRAVAAALPADAVLLLDAAYEEFAEVEATAAALESANVIVTRTLSKAWGLAGLRVGYAVSTPENIRELQTVGSPYPISTLALALAARELGTGGDRKDAYVARIQDERRRLEALLDRLGLEALPSQANFVYAKTDRAAWIQQALGSLGVQVRILESWPDGIRITCPGDEADFQRLSEALEAVLAPQVILFDMDGVLADVSGSYRASIRETVASWGAEVDDAEIDSLKAAGNANDDWILTRDILALRGIERTLEEVIERFEGFYQGEDGRPGLRETERLLATPEWLASLASRFTLGVVTGRPRSDAERFLEERGIASSFSTVVSREDAPSKPDPAPVKLALERLGQTAAWMLGDTPDDATAAQAAGVVPIAMIPPGGGPELKRGLEAVNPAVLIDSPDQIERYLP